MRNSQPDEQQPNPLHLPQHHPHPQKSRILIDQASKLVENDLINGKLIIPNEEKPFRLQHSQEKNEYNPDNKLKIIKQKKNELKKQLEGINFEEENIKMSQVMQRRLQKSRMKLHKSELSADDAENLKKLVLAHRRFEKQLDEKTKQYEKKMKKFQEQNQELIKKRQKEKHEKRKQQLQNRIQQMQIKRKEQQERFEEEKKILKEEIKKRRVHEELKQRWRERQRQEEREKNEMAQELRRMRNVDFQEIKEHTRKYDETIKAQKESRVNIITKNGESFYHSSFRDAVVEQQERKKEQQYERRLKILQFFQKRKAYGEEVRVNHKPSIKNSLNNSVTSNKENEAKALNLFETHQKGNQYMKTGNSKISHKKSDQSLEEKQAIKHRYKNYLAQLRGGGSERRLRTDADSAINKILNSNHLSEQQKIYKAKLLTQKMQSQKDDKNILKSINAKLKLLKQLQN